MAQRITKTNNTVLRSLKRSGTPCRGDSERTNNAFSVFTDFTTQQDPERSRENNQSNANKVPTMVQGDDHALTESEGFSYHCRKWWTDRENDDRGPIAKTRVLSGDHPIERFQFECTSHESVTRQKGSID